MVKLRNLFFLFFLSYFACGYATINFEKSIPENNSSISSFEEILLQFDLSEVVAEYGEGEWGICTNTLYSARQPKKAKVAWLYKGSEEGEVITYQSIGIEPNSELFRVGNTLTLSFPGVVIEPGQEYTVKVTYDIFAGKKGESSWETDTKLALLDNPIILSFVGSQDGLIVNSYTPNSEQPISKLSVITLTYDQPITVNEDIPTSAITLSTDGNTLAEASNIYVSPDNANSVCIEFEEQHLYTGEVYDINIPEGVVYSSNTILSNAFSIRYTGCQDHYFDLKSRVGLSHNNNDEIIEIGNFYVAFDFPEGYGFKAIATGVITINAELYKINEDNTSVKIGTYEMHPAEFSLYDTLLTTIDETLDANNTYCIVVPKGQVTAYDLNGYGSLSGWTNDEISITLVTPSAENIDTIEISGNIPSQTELIENVSFVVSPYRYKELDYDVVACDSPVIKLFENEEEISSYPLELTKVENSTVLQTKEAMNVSLAKGKTYRLVLPAGTVTPDHNFLGKYAANKELTFTIEGMATGELKAEFTSNIAEGQTASHIGVVSIYTANPVAAVEGAALELRNGEEVKTAPVRVSVENGYSHIYADFSDADHKALALERATEYTVVLPQGSVADAANESLINKEYSFSINGLEKEAEPIVPEYVSVDFTIDQYVSTSYRMVKGEPSTIKLNATDEWCLKSLTLNDEDVIENVSEEGFYTLPALEADAELAAEFSYYEDLEMTELSGVGSIEGNNGTISVYNDGGVIVIENLAAGDNVAVYTVNGMVIKSFVASKDVMYIDAPMGQVYIIRVNNAAVKLQH